MGSEPIAVSFPKEKLSGWVLPSSFVDRDGEEMRGSVDLRGNEGLVVRVGTDPFTGNMERS